MVSPYQEWCFSCKDCITCWVNSHRSVSGDSLVVLVLVMLSLLLLLLLLVVVVVVVILLLLLVAMVDDS